MAQPMRGGPVADRDSAPFWAALGRHELVAQCCGACRAYRCPPLPACHVCGAATFTWERLDGAGTVYSAIIVRHPIGSLTAAELPVAFATIEFAHGCRLVARVLGNAAVELGAPVQADFVHHEAWTELVVRPGGGS